MYSGGLHSLSHTLSLSVSNSYPWLGENFRTFCRFLIVLMLEKPLVNKRLMITAWNYVENCDETDFIKFATNNETPVALNNINDSVI